MLAGLKDVGLEMICLDSMSFTFDGQLEKQKVEIIVAKKREETICSRGGFWVMTLRKSGGGLSVVPWMVGRSSCSPDHLRHDSSIAPRHP